MTVARNAHDVFEHGRQATLARAPPPRVVAQRRIAAADLIQQPHHGARASERLERIFRGVVVHEAADAIAGIDRVPGEQRSALGCGHRFHPNATAEEHRAALIDDDQRRTFALFAIHLRVRFRFARRYAPVDRTHVVAGLIKPHLGEVDAATAVARQTAAAVRTAGAR